MLPCTSCHRHVHADETTCPFCRAPITTASSPMRASTMVIAAAGLCLLACGDSTVDPNDDFAGADYGGPPPCTEPDASVTLELGDNLVDTTSASSEFNTGCGGQSGGGPDVPLTFVAPAEGSFTFALENIDGWLIRYDEYSCAPYSNTCLSADMLTFDLPEGGYLSLMLDTSSGSAGTISVTQE